MEEIILQGEKLTLLPERALWWAARRTIIVSDVHWGKSGHFRKFGIALPSKTQCGDSQRLADVLHRYNADRLIITGDLFHSRYNKEVEAFTQWRAQHAGLHIDFVTGNHDILPREKYHAWNLEIHEDGLAESPFYFAHDAVQHPELFTIHGHIHPGIRVPGGRQSGAMPCFCINAHRMILPAFGQFTGTHRIQPQEFRGIYVVGDGKVLQCK